MNTHVTLQQIAELPEHEQARLQTSTERFMAQLRRKRSRQQQRILNEINADVGIEEPVNEQRGHGL